MHLQRQSQVSVEEEGGEHEAQPLIAAPQGLLQVSLDQRPAKKYFDRSVPLVSTLVLTGQCLHHAHCLPLSDTSFPQQQNPYITMPATCSAQAALGLQWASAKLCKGCRVVSTCC